MSCLLLRYLTSNPVCYLHHLCPLCTLCPLPPPVEARDRALADAALLATRLRDEILLLQAALERSEADVAERNTKIMILGSEINAKDAEIVDLQERLQVRGRRRGGVGVWGGGCSILSSVCMQRSSVVG